MDWGIWLIVAFVAVGFTIVALLWWIRFPKAARIVMRGQHVIITGGSSGIGLALAQLVAAEGAAVISLIARDPEKLAAAQASVQEYCKQKHSGTYHRPQVPLEVSAKPKP
jgi:3-dehydrosphinganine reductase